MNELKIIQKEAVVATYLPTYICDTAQIGHPHNNPQFPPMFPYVKEPDANTVMLGMVMPSPANVGLNLNSKG
jgi:hypothetical protein